MTTVSELQFKKAERSRGIFFKESIDWRLTDKEEQSKRIWDKS